MNIQCPECTLEDAYFNGVCYYCPDCGCTWNVDDD